MTEDRHADGVRSGEGDAVDARMVHQRLARFLGPVDEIDHSIGHASLDQALDNQTTGQAGRVAWFEDDRVAGDECRRHHPDR